MKKVLAAKVPPDILLMIARSTVVIWGYYYRMIVNLTQVCRHWRHALLSFPGLWTKIELSSQYKNIAFIQMLLHRSADYPLEIDIDFTDISFPEISPVCDLLPSHVHRVKTLKILIGKFERMNFYPECVNYVISMFNRSSAMLTYFSIHGAQVPENFLEEVAPNLKRLDIAFAPISYQMPIFRTVTQLHFYSVRGLASVHQLVDLLESVSSNLKVLEIDGLKEFPAVSDVYDPKGRYIHFGSLVSLTLHLEPDVLMVILGHITTPSNVDWSIDYDDRRPNLDITPLVSFFQNVQTGTDLHLNWYNYRSLSIVFEQGFSGRQRRTVILYSENCTHRLRALFTSLRLSEVRYCKIAVQIAKKERIDEHWSLLLPFFHLRLEKLHIWYGTRVVLDLLMAQLQPDLTSPCPQLKDLTVTPRTTRNTKLIRVLRDRKEAGLGLKNLRVDFHSRAGVKEITCFRKKLKNVAENIVVK